MIVTHFVETVWKDGEKTRYGWNRKQYGKSTKKNLLKLVEAQRDNFVSARLVHADSTVVATVEGGA